MEIRWLLACVALVGSGGQGNPGPIGMEAGSAIHASSALVPRAHRLRSPSDDELIRRDYPWRIYRSFPPAIRPWLRRADIEHGRCNANPVDNSPACNRMDRIERQL